MKDFIVEIEQCIQNKEFELALTKLNLIIESHPENTNLLLMRGDLFYNLQNYPKALNDYNKVIKFNSENKIVSSKIEMIKDIIKFQALDIYASTNLNKDPWLDD